MIAVVDFSTLCTKKLSEVLSGIDVEHKVTKMESAICSAEKVIIPDCKNVRALLQQLQLMNLYSLLKMVKKPILGINIGMLLMCERMEGFNLQGLGFFKADVLKKSGDPFVTDEMTAHKIKINEDSKLLKGVSDGSEFNFSNTMYVPVNDSTKADYDENDYTYSAVLEENNYYGIQFSPGASGTAGEKVLKNFAEL